VNPITFLIPEVLASNVEGAATLIGASADVVTVSMMEKAG
jgi:hypothetical protein